MTNQKKYGRKKRELTSTKTKRKVTLIKIGVRVLGLWWIGMFNGLV